MSDVLAVTALIASLVTLFAVLWASFYVEPRMSKSQIDDNVINFVNSLVTLLEKVPALPKSERNLVLQYLRDWDSGSLLTFRTEGSSRSSAPGRDL